MSSLSHIRGTPNECHPPALLGRTRERLALEQLLRDIRDKKGTRVLVLRGEPGIGKTALLEYLVASADGLRVARAAGVQSDMDMAFAGLRSLCAPLLVELDDLAA